VIERGGGDFHEEPNGTPRHRALAFLISSAWLTGEVARQGRSISDDAVDRALAEREEDNGRAEFRHSLTETGRTLADARLEIKTDLAIAEIRREIATHAGEVTAPELVVYYDQNPRPFRHHELRYVELIEKLSTPAAARALVRRIGTGKAFSKRAYHEALAQNVEPVGGTPTKDAVIRAIFAAKEGVVSRPMKLSTGWTVFIVRKIVPATVRPLPEVRDEVAKLLSSRREREFTGSFYKEYVRRWTARTHCSAGYVVQGCVDYTGHPVSEESQF
jgi:hypothetical protein